MGFGNEFLRQHHDADLLCQIINPRYRATAYGTLNFVSCGTAGFAVFAAGVLRDRKVDTGEILAFAAAALVVCALLLLLVKPQPPTSAVAAVPSS